MEDANDGGAPSETPVAELFEFENAKTSQKLEVFVWTTEQMHGDGETSLHYAFRLQAADMLYPSP